MSPAPPRTKVAIIGSGNIGTDLMIKVLRTSDVLTVAALAGIDPTSDGLARARRLGVPTTHDGVNGLLARPDFDAIDIILDATSAAAHQHNATVLEPYGKQLIDLTPAALGPYVVPPVNLDEHLQAPDLNMVTCGGQATVPIVAAVSRIAPVRYAEIIASISARSAGPGTRANIDEFTETTARALEVVGGAARGKAVIILNPADPPPLMRDTVHCVVDDDADGVALTKAIDAMVAEVAAYVPGYRLKQQVQIRPIGPDDPLTALAGGSGQLVSTFLEVEGAAHYLPAYAGNLDIMTSAALRVAERLATR
ncbi:acetaldehyde dehydrogenase (acetylating) [Streptomyces sp. NPDC058000]|uniref:acetaldehyde dehydrogenase (acetylating) n=1 Tax=Streptomyces sp. NPDC058000 TaxID=3346299 RepID=UPI0036F0E892